METATLSDAWHVKEMMQLLLKLCDPTITFLDKNPKGMKTYVYLKARTHVFTAALFKNLKPTAHQLMKE